MSEESMAFRRPTSDERRLLLELANIAGIAAAENWLDRLDVRPLNDGRMGSLELLSQPASGNSRPEAVVCGAAVQFTDEDGVEVVASLYVDENGAPFELDIWKTDFSPLLRIAATFKRLEE